MKEKLINLNIFGFGRKFIKKWNQLKNLKTINWNNTKKINFINYFNIGDIKFYFKNNIIVKYLLRKLNLKRNILNIGKNILIYKN